MNRANPTLYYKTYGQNNGYTIVFLHGYLESSESWANFANIFSDEYFVVCIDLPGHGRSAVISKNSTMEENAAAVISVTTRLGIQAFHLVGHSMGGYLSMALLEHYPGHLNSVVLFHSTCFADSEEKKANRDREADLVRNGKKELIINTNIPRLYATDNLGKMASQVEISKKIASLTPDAGVISALNAMKSRPDRSSILAATDVPVLLVGGRKDNLIHYEKMEEMKALSAGIKLVCLENSGHMGFIEEREKAAKELKNFFDENFECQ